MAVIDRVDLYVVFCGVVNSLDEVVVGDVFVGDLSGQGGSAGVDCMSDEEEDGDVG